MHRKPINHQETFDHVLSMCPRSITGKTFIDDTGFKKLNMSGDEIKSIDNAIATGHDVAHNIFIDKPISKYRITATSTENLMFSLIVNTLGQLSFRTGDCLYQSSLLIVELAKKGVFTQSTSRCEIGRR